MLSISEELVSMEGSIDVRFFSRLFKISEELVSMEAEVSDFVLCIDQDDFRRTS